MGAQTLAFLPIRYSLITEGAADFILLPTILKAATQLDNLGFQVVPGLASGTENDIRILDHESPRTAYLVDNDSAGTCLKAKILRAGVAKEMLITLPAINDDESVIEDYLPTDTYYSAVREELRRSGNSQAISTDDIARPNRPKRLEKWCKANGISIPSKRAVAYWVTENQHEFAVLDEASLEKAKCLFERITRALGLER